MSRRKDPEIKNRLKEAIGEDYGDLKRFADESGIPYTTIQSYLGGVTTPGLEALRKIAENTQIDLYWLITGKAEPGGWVRGKTNKAFAALATNPAEIQKQRFLQWLDAWWAKAAYREKLWLLVQLEKSIPDFTQRQEPTPKPKTSANASSGLFTICPHCELPNPYQKDTGKQIYCPSCGGAYTLAGTPSSP